MADMTTEMMHLAASGQTAALNLLLAEMEALRAMLPGTSPEATDQQTEAATRAHDAEVEADFDNMPI